MVSLEVVFAAEEERELRQNGYYHELNYDLNLNKLDFIKYRNEWAAMAAYDKKIYEQQLLDEKTRNTQLYFLLFRNVDIYRRIICFI